MSPTSFNTEIITIIISSLGGIGTILSLFWLKFIKPILKVVNNHENVVNSINLIKKELTTNGGNSLKDAVLDLKSVCQAIERRQRIIEQRTKAALHYSNVPLFETDHTGRLIWNNAQLADFIKDNTISFEGYDWLTIIEEQDREELLNEFQSCLSMNRKFSKIAKTQNGKNIRMLGYPYRITDSEHGGFLVSILEINEV